MTSMDLPFGPRSAERSIPGPERSAKPSAATAIPPAVRGELALSLIELVVRLGLAALLVLVVLPLLVASAAR